MLWVHARNLCIVDTLVFVLNMEASRVLKRPIYSSSSLPPSPSMILSKITMEEGKELGDRLREG